LAKLSNALAIFPVIGIKGVWKFCTLGLPNASPKLFPQFRSKQTEQRKRINFP